MSFEKGRDKTGGRKRGTPNKATEAQNAFQAAYEADKEKYGSNIFTFFFEQAREEGGAVLVAVMRKILPDMKQVEVTKRYEGGYADMTPAEAARKMDEATVGIKPDVK